MKPGAVLPEALRDALGKVIASERREWRREREIIEAQSRAFVAELQTRVVELEARLEAVVSDRLSTLKDGEPGVDGAPGADGRNGDPGRDGANGEVGERGSDGVAGRDGVDGKDGQPGERGLQGERGEPGPDPTAEDLDAAVARYFAANPVPAGPPGEQGPAGERGETGADGERGPAGTDGSNGRDGIDGPPGERGEAGAPGKLPIVRSWDDRVYYEGEVATREGGTFQAIRDTGRAPPHDDWQCIAAAGVNGRDGASFNIRGTHAADDSYSAFDVVALNGASFAAKRDNPGPCPGDGWQMLAMQGKRGNPGERGPQGPKGSAGEAGSPVVALDINEDGLITLTNGDGTTAEGDLYPVLTKLAR